MNNPNIKINHVKEILHQISNVKSDIDKKDDVSVKVKENLEEKYNKRVILDKNPGFLSLATPKLIEVG